MSKAEADKNQVVLRVSKLKVQYGDLVGVEDISLDVQRGDVVALLGANGSGKTTTLKAIAGLLAPVHGHVQWEGKQIDGLPAYSIVGKGLTLSPEGWQLFLGQTVEQNLRLGATVIRNKSRIRKSLERTYELFPRLADRRRQRAGTLSGGERQMLAIGRALMSEPQLLMLDEPSLGLAPAIVEQLYDNFDQLHEQGLTILLAEQSIEIALEHADYGYVIQTGCVVTQGEANYLAKDPAVQRAYLGI
jgi:branched-chain amino acid transport system ATP-binding protein